MTHTGALKLALQALGNSVQLTPDVSLIAQCREAIAAIKQALAQPVQEPVGKVIASVPHLRSISVELLPEAPVPSEDSLIYTTPPAQPAVPLTDDAVYAAAEIAWRAGWVACRDAEFVGEEAEDDAWGYQGATVANDIKSKLREKNAAQPAVPYGWVRMNPGFNSGVFHLGTECPPGWVGGAVPVSKIAAPEKGGPA